MSNFIVFLSILLSSASFSLSVSGSPLSTNSGWIVDSSGQRVKLTCVGWAGHLEPMIVEGLHKRPLSLVVQRISLMGFNCVHLSYATQMYTRHNNLSVVQSLNTLGLENAMRGIEKNNPKILGLNVVEAQKAVIDELSTHGLMVVLDNEVSRPMKCCQDDDGNGFFGDANFDSSEWLEGLRVAAETYNDTSIVVAMSLRSELRGPGQTDQVWYENIRKGADTIHKANARVLILIPGLNHGQDFTQLQNEALRLNIGNKSVYFTHQHASSMGEEDEWLQQPTNVVCKRWIDEVKNKTDFLLHGSNAAPILFKEFGIGGVNKWDSLFTSCYLAYLAEKDFDWAVTNLQGSYYLRNGIEDDEEVLGLLESNWTRIRSPHFVQRLQSLQMQKTKGHKIMFHPLTGMCIRADMNQIHTGDCIGATQWSHAGNGAPIQPEGKSSCLITDREGISVLLSTDCEDEKSSWESISSTKYHIANKEENGNYLCLDFDPSYSSRVVASKCICTGEDSNCLEDPQRQWFQFI